MALFGRDSETTSTTARPSAPQVPQDPTPAAAASAPSNSTTHIGRGGRIKGEISGPISIVIDGEFEGSLTPDEDVRVGKAGVVVGEIEARVITVGGRVHGNVRARERVEILPTGSLEGDIAAPQMAIADGAYFKGRVEMTGGPKDAKTSGGAS